MGDEWPINEVFDEDYMHFYSPRLTDELSDGQAATIWNLLGLSEGDSVLDLACGHGRIANRLAQRGAAVTALDATPLFLDAGRQDALDRQVSVDYFEGDMRTIPWIDRFDAVVSWFTAFGYFDDDANRDVLIRVHGALRHGGRLLVELNHKDGLLPCWLPCSVSQSGDGILIDEQVFDPLTGRANTRRTIVHDGDVRHVSFFTRLFSYTELRDWLLGAGFRTVAGFAGDGSALTAASRRMVLVAEK